MLRNTGRPEALSERREGYPDPVLAETLGEAIALQLWTYDEVGSDTFPQDFWA